LPGAELVAGDVTNPEVLRSVIDRDDVSVFHLASMVSAACEVDFDAALDVNIGGARAVLEACRARASRPRLVFVSSVAAFGGEVAGDIVTDNTKLTPENTYGMTKAVCELLLNDYTRKGFLDGRSARTPTVVIRPGRPNAAASGWVSGLFREPLSGQETVVPVDLGFRVAISGYRTVVENLVRLHEVDGDALGIDRGCNLPALNPSAEEMIATLRRVVDKPLGDIRMERNPAIVAVLGSWPQQWGSARAIGLGLKGDINLEQIIQEYREDFGDRAVKAS
jgi:nucleoside-diphosphate-sugar epimerase